ERATDLWARFAAASRLAERNSQKYYHVAEATGLAILHGKADSHAAGEYGPVTEWLLKHGGEGAVVKIAECMTNPDPSAIEYEEILDAAFDAVDRAALPLIRASLQRDEFKGSNGKRVVAFPHVMARLERLLALKEPSDDELIVMRINSLVADPANCR